MLVAVNAILTTGGYSAVRDIADVNPHELTDVVDAQVRSKYVAESQLKVLQATHRERCVDYEGELEVLRQRLRELTTSSSDSGVKMEEMQAEVLAVRRSLNAAHARVAELESEVRS